MKAFYALVCLALLSGCITAKKELNGRYTKVAQVENRSLFGTNQGFARLERCDGPEKKVLWFSESDFTNCVYLTHADQLEYEHGYSRGAGPEIVGAAIMGASLGTGAALSGGAKATASGSASAVNIANQSVNVKKH